MTLLSDIIWAPIVFSLLLLVLGSEKTKLSDKVKVFSISIKSKSFSWVIKRENYINVIILLFSLISFFNVIKLCVMFDYQTSAFQFYEEVEWMSTFGINYTIGIDGISLPLVVLTCFFTPLLSLTMMNSKLENKASFFAAIFALQGIMCGVFLAIDTMLFYILWEAMLVPMFLLIGVWGGSNRIYASFKFFLYTFLGSIFLLVAILYLSNKANTFNLISFYNLKLSAVEQRYLFLAMFIAFAVKIPMWPVHTWLPDAHVQAPTAGSVILAAIMLKMGAYGLFRFVLPLCPIACIKYAHIIVILSLISISYIGFVAVSQKDMKKLIAYSSIAHMGFVTLGIFIIFTKGVVMYDLFALQGAYMQMISHGFISGALFICIGVLYDRVHSREIEDYRGIANSMPIFACFFVFFSMANSGLPGTSGFVGEFLVIISSFQYNYLYSVVAATTLILAAVYNLWLVKRIIFGKPLNSSVASLKDINLYEIMALSVLVLLVLLLGLVPHTLLHISENSMLDLIRQMSYGVAKGL